MTINSKMGRREFLGWTALGTTAFRPPQTIQGSTAGEYEVALSTFPHRIYKENDSVVEPATTESFVFNLVVREKHNRAVDPANARGWNFIARRNVSTSSSFPRRLLLPCGGHRFQAIDL